MAPRITYCTDEECTFHHIPHTHCPRCGGEGQVCIPCPECAGEATGRSAKEIRDPASMMTAKETLVILERESKELKKQLDEAITRASVEYLVKGPSGKWEICSPGVFYRGEDATYELAWATRRHEYFCSGPDALDVKPLPDRE